MKIAFRFSIIYLCLFISLISYSHDLPWLTAPYLQNVKPNGITIMWEIREKKDIYINYSTDQALKKSKQARSTNSKHDSHIYKVELIDLKPGATYYYRISNEDMHSYIRTFRTAPLSPQPFSFGVWSDSQGHNRGIYNTDIHEPTKSMMKHMADSGVDIALTSGDLAENGGNYQDVRNYFLDRIAKYLGQSVPFFPAWGNHEPNRQDIIRKFADTPAKNRTGMDPGWGSYSFDYAGVHFICIDFSTMKEDIKTWLEDDLKSSLSNNPRYTFLFIHIPPYCELWIDGDKWLRSRLVPLLEQYGVDAVFSGHTHEYERGYKEHVHYIITGGGSWLDWEEPIVKDWEHMFVGGAKNLAEFRHGLINEYVRVDVEMDEWIGSMHAFQPNGDYIGVRDRFGSMLKDANGDGLLTGPERIMPSNYLTGMPSDARKIGVNDPTKKKKNAE